MKYRLILSCLLWIGLPGMQSICHADAVKLSKVTRGEDGETRTYDVFIGKHTGKFVAMGGAVQNKWILTITLDTSSKAPLPGVGDNETSAAIFKCLAQFRDDEPRGVPVLVQMEIRASSRLWAEFKKIAVAFLNTTSVDEYEQHGKNDDFEHKADRFLSQSQDARKLARLIAARVGCAVTSIGYGFENSFDPNVKQMSDLAARPDLGMGYSPVMAIRLKPLRNK